MLKTIRAFLTKFFKGVILFFFFSLLSSFTIIQLDTDSSDSDSETGKGKRVADPVKCDQVSLTESKVSDCKQVSPAEKVSDWDQISPKTIPQDVSNSDQISPLTLPKPVSSVGEGDKAGTYKLDYRTLGDTPRPSGGSSAAILARLQGMYTKVVEVEHEDKKKECIDQGLDRMDHSMMTEDQKNTSDTYVSTSNSLAQAYGLLNKYNTQVFKESSSASSSTAQDTSSNLPKRRMDEALSEAPSSKKRLTSDSSSEDEKNYPRFQNRSDDGHDSDKGYYSDEEL